MGERPSESIGLRVRAAREDAGYTQAELVSGLGFDRSALAKIETGTRKITALELASIAERLNVRLEWFLEDAPSAVLSRRNMREPGAASPAIDKLAERLAREVEFTILHDERLGAIETRSPLRHPKNRSEVESTAEEARQLLGVDVDEPLLDLSSKVESLGLFPFSVDLGADAADGASLLLERGGVAVVNGHLHLGRRRLTLAHELGHYLFADEFSVDWQVADPMQSDNRESRIDHFARALLLPVSALTTAWEQHRADDRSLREAAVLVGSEFRVDMSTLARRLSELRVVSNAESQSIRAVRTTRADFIDFNLLVRDELAPPELPRSYIEAVLRLYRREVVAPARALDLLLDTWDEADLPELSTLPEQAIWSFVS